VNSTPPPNRHRPFGAPDVPPGCDDYDVAVWFAIREQIDGELPRQDLDSWVLEQRARRTRDVTDPGRVDAYDASSEAIAGALVRWAGDMSPESRAWILAEFGHMFGRVEALRPEVWREYLRGILEVVAHAAPEDAARTAAWAIEAIDRHRNGSSSPGEYDDALGRVFHAGRYAELSGAPR